MILPGHRSQAPRSDGGVNEAVETAIFPDDALGKQGRKHGDLSGKKKHPTRVVFHFSWLQKTWFGILDFYGARDYSKFISTVGEYYPCRTPQTGSHIKSAPDCRTRRYPSYAVDIVCKIVFQMLQVPVLWIPLA